MKEVSLHMPWSYFYLCFCALLLPLTKKLLIDCQRCLLGIDIGITALTLAKEIYPGLNINAYSKKIDTIVSNVRNSHEGKHSPGLQGEGAEYIYLYQIEGFSYDMADPYVNKIWLGGIIFRAPMGGDGGRGSYGERTGA